MSRELSVRDGEGLRASVDESYDVVVIGSGPAGATVAREAARAGMRVAVIEEGPLARQEQLGKDGFTAMARFYRDMGTSLSLGNPPMPYLQGRVVGGTSVVNGAISWRLPRDVWQSWVDRDRALEGALPFDEIERITDQIERDLSIAPTPDQIAGPNNLLLGKGASARGIEHRPISRNVSGCEGLGKCLQGCPKGHKLSMDVTYLPDACERGAVIFSSTRAVRVVVSGGRATAVIARAAGGGKVKLRARAAVVLAASCVQTPLLLRASGLEHGPVGKHFTCHPGASMAGRFDDEVKMWQGATQGHEAIGLRAEGIKFEALGYDISIVAARMKGFGKRLSAEIADITHWANWGAAIKAKSEGTVLRGPLGPMVLYSLSRDDMRKVRRGIRVMGEMMLAAGAAYVTPGVHGWHDKVTDQRVMARFEEEGPLEPSAYTMALTHMFGTCRMGSSADDAVVRPDFRHHTTAGLYVADSSVFPSNTGVNPQTSIIALATLCGRHVARL